MPTHLNIEGLDVSVEGQGPVVLMLHGWPDSPALWDESVAALRDAYRCVRLALPGYDLNKPSRPVSAETMTALLDAVVNTVSPDEPVTLLLHDWGCLFGYEYAARHPQRVVRVVGVDIGDTQSGAYRRSLKAKEKAMIAGYQLWLALSWYVGRVWPALGTRMTRFMARTIGCRTPAKRISWQMNYPYAMQWLGACGGLRRLARADHVLGVQMPILFIFGKRKPFMFHSARWLATLATTPGCQVLGFDAGHWLMKQQPGAFNRAVRDWLDGAA
jgi:cis-3-alkyl-4-acyloxetan-2-one decarboxylase